MRIGSGRLSLRSTLLSLLVGVLLATVVSVATVTQISVSGIVEDMVIRLFTVSAQAISAQVRAYFAPATPLLGESLEQARRGQLRVDDPDAVADYVIGRLRRTPTVGWLSFSEEQTGRFVGAWRRDDGAIILNRSAPDVNEGHPTEVVVSPDGRQTPLQRNLPGGYDPRQRPWYQQAIASEGVVWTEPFAFNEGAIGITAAVALRAVDTAAPLGVFTADFFLDDTSRFLDTLARSTSVEGARLLLLSRQGVVVADSSGQTDQSAPTIADAGQRALPGGFDGLERGSPEVAGFNAQGTEYIGGLQAVGGDGGPEWIALVVIPEAVVLRVVYDQQQTALLLGLLFLVVAVVLGSVLAHRVASPLHAVALDLEQVGRFDLSPTPSRSSFVTEIAVVGDSVDRMKAGLRSFSHYVPMQVVGDLLARGEEARLGAEHRRLTIFFSDIDGFTRIAERMEPDRLVEHLSEYLQEMTAIVQQQAGTIDKFLGDGILGFFNAPHDVPDHVARACRAAVRSQERLHQLRNDWKARGAPAFHARIGLEVGEVLVGNIGTPDRFEYTVVGDAVNVANRLESLNKLYGTSILASEEVRRTAGSDFEWRTVDRVAVVGREESTLVCELLGERGAIDAGVLRARETYERGLSAYVEGQFTEAATRFREAAILRPRDRAAEVMAGRAETLTREQQLVDWDGVYTQLEKL